LYHGEDTFLISVFYNMEGKASKGIKASAT